MNHLGELQPKALKFPRNNNLEWLRLLFAIQVVVVHAGEHLHFGVPAIVNHFPGVPAFFFVSGFLIYASYCNAPDRRYFENRFLRLFPGLVFVTFGSMAVVLVAHGWRDLTSHLGVYVFWFFTQISLGQAYNPALFRDVGVGALNGSLWTITTEILFYACVPLIVWLERKVALASVLLIFASFSIYVAGPLYWNQPVYHDKTIYNILAITPLPWGWMFGLGILTVKHFDVVERGLKYLPIAVIPLTLMIVFRSGTVFASEGNRVGLLYFVTYICLILWLGFGTQPFPLKFDLSYGVYIWHMPVINLLLVLATPLAPIVAFVLTFGAAAISWTLVEKPSLKLKRRSLKPIGVSYSHVRKAASNSF